MDDYPTSELWLGGLLPEVGVADVREVLGRYGTVHFCHLGQHPSKRLGYAKATMGSVAEASTVLSALNGTCIPQLSGSGHLTVHFARVGLPVGAAPPPHVYRQYQAAAATPHSPRLGHSSSTGSCGTATPKAAAANGKPASPAAPQVAPRQHCGGCGKVESAALPLRRCSACKVVAYCCTACQHSDWADRHSAECGTLQQLAGLLAAQPTVAATLRSALDAPASSLGRGVATLLESKLAASKEVEQVQQEEQQVQQQAQQEQQEQQQAEAKEQAAQPAGTELPVQAEAAATVPADAAEQAAAAEQASAGGRLAQEPPTEGQQAVREQAAERRTPAAAELEGQAAEQQAGMGEPAAEQADDPQHEMQPAEEHSAGEQSEAVEQQPAEQQDGDEQDAGKQVEAPQAKEPPASKEQQAALQPQPSEQQLEAQQATSAVEESGDEQRAEVAAEGA